MNLPYIFSILLLVFGFGFVIFWHELGHFLAAKWVGVKVEQFAVGFGHAIVAWRKGIGLRVGTTQREYERRVKQYVEKEEGHLDRKDRSAPTSEQLSRAAEKLGLGETEYRLNWIPLGGYVKMLGQDDLNPNSTSDDPRAFNKKSIGARMLVVSAGVIMNVILAAIGFMLVFMIGFNVPPATVGGIAPGSPAQEAKLRTGDEIWTYDGKRQYDWTKVQLNVALSGENESVPLEVKRRTADGGEELVKLTITPRRELGDPKGFLSLGIMNPRALKGVSEKEQLVDTEEKLAELYPKDMLKLKPGDVITAINGQPVDAEKDLPSFDAALQASYGAPLQLTVKDKDGAERQITAQPHFSEPFGGEGFNLVGMVPRTIVNSIDEESEARGKLRPGDIIAAVVVGSDASLNPSRKSLVDWLNKAGQNGKTVDMHVIRDGADVQVKGLSPSMKVARNRKGLGIGLSYDEQHPVVAEVLSGSPAADAGIPNGARITAVNGKPVSSWYDVHRQLAAAPADQLVSLEYRAKSGEQKKASLALSAQQIAGVQDVRYTHNLYLGEPRVPRKAANAFQAMGWGVTETRDFILQFYVTIRRMVDGTVSPANLMGPIGIFHAGTKFAYKGHDWLIWFLAMISANLAVVNFLPIPIVDGGLFAFLVLEKIKGRPLSAKTQTIAQFVGMAVLLCVFLLVTYQDIARLTFMR
jgi:regulator of sigma E protease